MTKKKSPRLKLIYQIKVTLEGIQPPIWRRFLVRSDITLRKFHHVLQDVMGWTNSHLHKFVVEEKYEFGEPDYEFDMDISDDRKMKLSRISHREDYNFTYIYDFGDNWCHELCIEKFMDKEEGMRYPVCLEGGRACPPEDCGGIYGYSEMLEIIHDPYHEEHESMMVWLGGGYDPEAFDLDAVNKELRKIKRHRY